MEEVYVIKLKGIPSAATSETSASADTQDLLRMSTLGLGVLHLIFGVLVLLFGALRSAAEQEPSATIFGTLFGPIFLATGVAAIVSARKPYRTLKVKVLFGLSLFSACGSAAFLALCFLGLVYFHSVPRAVGESARVTANAMLAAAAELVVSLLSVFAAGSAIWRVFQFGAFRPHVLQRPLKQRVIVKTNIVGAPNAEGLLLDEEVVRHISPNCVISLRATDDRAEVARRVEEYVRDLHAHDDLSLTFSDISTTQDEQDLGLDSESWGNEVVAIGDQPQLKET